MAQHSMSDPGPVTKETVFRGVHPDWRRLVFEEYVGPHSRRIEAPAVALDDTFKAIAGDAELLEPPVDKIAEAFRYSGPSETSVVIIGQDPYPERAMGLCFSCERDLPVRNSLVNIFACLDYRGLRKPHLNAKGISIVTPDLRPWAAQGVLLLNAALTTRRGVSRAHKADWDRSSFVPKLVRAFAFREAKNNHKVVFMLWGGDAQKFARDIRMFSEGAGYPAHEILEWSHPGPMADNRLAPSLKFARCPHFTRANEILATPIVWDPLAPVLAFTDGGCKANNATLDADAAYGIFIAGGPAHGTEIYGRVEPYEYRLVDPGNPALGFEPDYDAEHFTSNNRGEYLAWCWCLLALLRSHALGPIEVVSDCNLFIQTMRAWLPEWKRKGIADKKKNADVIRIADALMTALKAETFFELKMTHVNASHDVPRPAADAPPRDRVLWAGNDRADRLTERIIGRKTDPVTPIDDRGYDVHVETESAPVLHRLA